MKDAPGKRWSIILGIAGFIAGFIGPMIFVPDANQGPMVGIFISGPAGAIAGLIMRGLCSLFAISAPVQWRTLYVMAIAGAFATLLCVQPAPALEGTLLEAEVVNCSSPSDAETDTLKYWQQRIAQTTWATPREGWQSDMRNALQSAPGVLLQLTVTRQNSVYSNRKPWNRGSLFTSGWKDSYEKKNFYLNNGSCNQYLTGSHIKAFQRYDLNGKIEAPTAWPPHEIENFINASILSDVPDTMKRFQ